MEQQSDLPEEEDEEDYPDFPSVEYPDVLFLTELCLGRLQSSIAIVEKQLVDLKKLKENPSPTGYIPPEKDYMEVEERQQKLRELMEASKALLAKRKLTMQTQQNSLANSRLGATAEIEEGVGSPTKRRRLQSNTPELASAEKDAGSSGG